LLFIAQSVWHTEKKDESKRAMSDGACRVTFKYLVAFKVVTPQALIAWRNDTENKSTGKAEAMEEVGEWIDQIERKRAAAIAAMKAKQGTAPEGPPPVEHC